jgi:CheY-like chemotaxis protein
VLHANTGQRALALAHDDRPDAITLDLMMPLQDGLELLKCLKADPATRDTPVVVCSVLREQALAISLGADQFLVKPVTQQALLAALHRGLRSEER